MRQYLDALEHVLNTGERRSNRTGTDTLSTFGYQMRFDLRRGFPVLTTKRVQFKSVVKELLFFLRGGTNTVDLGCGIWDAWAGEHGELDYCYGEMWRQYPGKHRAVDQIQELIDRMQRDPDSRRHIICAWNPEFQDKASLAWCHMLAQFNVTEEWVDCVMTQRSADLALGVPFNIASYALLTHMVAVRIGRKPRHFIHELHDMHLYVNHLDGIREQLKRQPRDLPKLILRAAPTTELWDYQVSDIDLESYEPLEAIKFEVAV